MYNREKDLEEELEILAEICKDKERVEIRLIKALEQVEILARLVECRADEDCDHCEALRFLEE